MNRRSVPYQGHPVCRVGTPGGFRLRPRVFPPGQNVRSRVLGHDVRRRSVRPAQRRRLQGLNQARSGARILILKKPPGTRAVFIFRKEIRLLVRVGGSRYRESGSCVAGDARRNAEIIDITVHVARRELASSHVYGRGRVVHRTGHGTVAPLEGAIEVKSQRSRLSGDRDVVPAVRLERGGGLLAVRSSEVPRGRPRSIHPERQLTIGALFVEFERHPLEVVF